MMKPNTNWKVEDVGACLLCCGTQTRVNYERDICGIPLQFVQCVNCGLIYQNPRLTAAALEEYFNSSSFIKDAESNTSTNLDDMLGYYDYFAWDASYRKTASLRLKNIGKFIPANAKLLEIGTSTGSFLNEARQAGFDVEGLDISAVFASMAAQAYGLTIHTDFIEDAILPEAYYDVICSFGGIACWRYPLKGLENVRKALKPPRIFVLNHPNVDGILGKVMGPRYPEYNHASLTI